ncbi:hypothetical protein V5O48_005717 [Marasmius crinis-equi]|uniref:Enhancer of mRNA-decapping protein 3 n=1 Tax=Marasmius crinis-equi TaxID=585013 RepID=A0ABR3FLH6_9AGAR
MSKRIGRSPTIWQTLLNRPSQSYSFPQVDKKEYYSAKDDMVRVALQVEAESLKVKSVATSVPYEGTATEAATLRTTKSIPQTAGDAHPGSEPQISHLSHSTSPPELTLVEEEEMPSSNEDSDSDNDIFYTPNASPRVSVASAASVVTVSARTPASPTPSPTSSLSYATATNANVTRSGSPRSVASTSADSASVDGSIFSSYASSSSSTVITTPEISERSSSTRGTSRTKGKNKETKVTGMGEDWAKDVRWLVPPPSLSASSSSSRSSSSSKSRDKTQPRRHSRSSSASKYQPTIMTTLVEEDEGLPASIRRNNSRSSQSKGKGSSNVSPTNVTPINVSPPKRRQSTRSNTSSTPPTRPKLARRRSRSLEDMAMFGIEDDALSSSSTPSSSYTAPLTTPSLPSYGTPGYTSLTLPRAPPPSSGFLVPSGKAGKVDLTRSGVAQTTMASVEVTRGLSSSASSSKKFSWLSKEKGLVPVSAKGKGRQESAFSFTSYRKPPAHVPEGHALIQVWAVGVDGVDASLCGISFNGEASNGHERRTVSEDGHADLKVKRGWSLKRDSHTSNHKPSHSAGSNPKLKQPEVGFVPGRSFVGRIMEVGDEDTRGAKKKGEWVVGLTDARECGALQEFIVVERHRIHSVPYPSLPPSGLVDPTSPSPPSSPAFVPSPARPSHEPHDSRYPAHIPTSTPLSPDAPRTLSKTQLTIEELALLPACGVQAYRAVRTFVNPTGRGKKSQGRVLVVRGHDGVGAVATQMLVNRGWSVYVHAPLRSGSQRHRDEEMRMIQERVTGWGADEVIFDDGGGVAEAIQHLIDDNEAFDGVLDTVGGKDIWELGKKLLSGHGGSSPDADSVKQFTTLVGDFPHRPVPSASDHFKSSLRSMKGGDGNGASRVAYSWISIDQDVDFEGGDVAVGISKVLSECTGGGELRPFVGDGRVVTFERAHEVFRPDGGLEGGGTVVVRVVL